MEKIIYIDRNLTSAVFYNTVLPQVQIILRYYDKISEVILDFSGTVKIEPNVIPNLLSLGRVIESLSGLKAIIRIPETFEGGKLKNYLYQIKFIQLAKSIFEFESDPYTGFDGKPIDPLCKTIFFDKETSRDEIGYELDGIVGPFANKYLANYNKLCLENGQVENNIVNLLKELAVNATDHGKSYSYTTIHAKYSDKTIYIAISDGGVGFLQSCLDEHAEELISNNKVINNEVEAILYCVYLRGESKIFGLYSVIKDTIGIGGTVRIHSNTSQVIFTKRIEEQFEKGILLKDYSFNKYNVRNNLNFSGAHIEIEVPF